MKTIAVSLPALIIMCLLLALTGCSVTVAPDGSKSATVNGPEATAFARTIAEAFAQSRITPTK